MALSLLKYNYSFDMVYLNSDDGYTFTVDPINIKNVFITEDYENNNMPMIFISLALDKKQIVKMTQTIDTAKIILSKYKFVVNNDLGIIKELCFREDFTYFIDGSSNFVNDLDYNERGENDNQLFKTITIGLLMISHVNGTRTCLDGIFSGTNMVNLVYSILSDRPTLIEPFSDNSVHSNIIIPPSTSKSQALEKLNNISAFYETKYRFFQGIECNYLVSSSGVSTKKKNEKMCKFIININPVRESDKQPEGIMIDTNQSCYVLDLYSSEISINKNMAFTKSFNQLDTVDSTGNVTSTKVIDKGLLNTKRNLVRIANDNNRKITNIVNNSGETIWLQFSRNNMDDTVFTINKEYNLRFNNNSGGKDGLYLLCKKDSIYYRYEDNYLCTTKLTFKLCKNEV